MEDTRLGEAVTDVLARYSTSVSFEDLPHEVVHKAKRCMLNFFGSALGGYKHSKIAWTTISLLRDLGCAKPIATIIGSGDKTHPAFAGFANAQMANALDLDDTSDALGHPGPPVFATVCALGEQMHASGKDIITAAVVGYEVAIRVGTAVYPSLERVVKSWGTAWTAIGAAASAGRLMNLSDKEMANVFGIAGFLGPMSAVPRFNLRPHMVKDAYGWIACNSILAVLLTKLGFTGPHMALDGDVGFWRWMGSDRCDFERMTQGLGEKYEILDVYLKPYPACTLYHASIDAVLEIVKSQKLRPIDIDEINLRLMSNAPVDPEHLKYQPASLVEAPFVIPYTIALLVHFPSICDEWFSEQKLTDPDILKLARKINVVKGDPEVDDFFRRTRKMGNIVDVVANGKRYSKRVDTPSDKGPMSISDLHTKFENLAQPTISKKAITKIIKTIDRIEELSDIYSLMRLLY
jgi:2-methylcitrate dehydratase PrpD